MRHLKRGRKLSRTSTHRKAMVRNLVASLFEHGRVVTTPAKAKEAKPFAEKLITLAKRGTLHDRRRAISLLNNSSMVKSLFEEIGPRYAERPGGYCRILHLAKTRVGDSAPQALFELVESEMPQRAATTPAKVEEAPVPVAGDDAPVVEGEEAAPAEEAATPDTASADTAAEESAAVEGESAAESETAAEGDADADDQSGK